MTDAEAETSRAGHDGVVIRLLGTFSVELGERRVGPELFERRSAAELVQLLALTPGRRLHRERALEALFRPAARARRAGAASRAPSRLYKAASYARRALGTAEAVVMRDQMVSLFPEHRVCVDVDVVEAAALDDPVAVAEALAAYRGDLLPDAPYTEWLIEHRARLRQKYVDLLRRSQRWAELAAVEPTDEEAHLALMRHAIDQGNRAQAVRQFETMERALARLGLLPGKAALELRAAAQADSGPAPHAQASVAGPPGRRLTDAGGSLIGRTAECHEVRSALASSRLVTITGPGGVGKTLLARHVGVQIAEAGGEPTWLCQFANVADPAGVLQQMVTAIGAQTRPNTSPIEAVVAAIGPATGLVILDNCEHQLDTVRRLCRAVLDRCPGIRLMATSREPLRLRSEWLHRLGPLSRATAIELFLHEARRNGVTVGHDDPAIERICRRLDDLPLAVVLAAARSRSLSLAAVEALLEDRFDRLRSAPGAEGQRHQSLGASIAWSVDGLDPQLAEMLDDLATFADRFTLDAALAVAARPGRSRAELVDSLDELVTRSLVVGPAQPDGGYRLLESVRLYLRERFADRPPHVETAAQRHLDYFAARAERSRQLLQTRARLALDRFDTDWDDLRITVATAERVGDLGSAQRIVGASAMYSVLTQRSELLEWCGRLFAGGDLDASAAAALGPDSVMGWSYWLAMAGEFERARTMIHETLPRSSEHPGLRLVSGRLCALSNDIEGARRWFDMSPIAAPSQWPIERGFAILNLALLDFVTGRDLSTAVTELTVLAADGDAVYRSFALLARGLDLSARDRDAAVGCLAQAQELADALGIPVVSATARTERARIVAASGDRPVAADRTVEALSWAHEQGLWTAVVATLPIAASLIARCGRPDVAISLLAARTPEGQRHDWIRDYAATVEALRRAHEDRFDTWWRIGGALDPTRAADLAIRTLGESCG